MRQLVFVHGRAQENKDSVALKAEWIEAWEEGLAKSGLTLPIAEHDVRFPYYGDTLFDLAGGTSADQAAQIIVRGTETDDDEKRFVRAVIAQIQEKVGITDAQLIAIGGEEVVQRGPLNWEWLQTFLKAVDRHVPHGSGSSIALFTHDVYQYLKNTAIRGTIDNGVAAAIKPGVETVVVSHSLGTVVAYNLLRQLGQARGWNIPLFVTLGSPLAVTEIRNTLKPIAQPTCVPRWINAMDNRDVVALYPLDTRHFAINPPGFVIENRTDIRNRTRNRHGIAGYLDDPWVAAQIHAALTA
ncbi:alpha/beta hydrolase [Montanilutibacter psychrotolerans]|uniref:Alpha/beta hydrolase n=1 Tax=Montanilutibacter psychrotolerans TaxID=1327343 RepID=A0A3M8SND5_9GAMM|nr:alpha/beta hydrolase [Lysobacter psychrotolerans]RNF82841.1 alpha/beta hydrolase [Lysobacter psychrotolerans]